MNTITIPKNTTKKLIKKLKAKKSQTKKGGGKIKQAIIEEEDTLMEKFKNVYSDVFTIGYGQTLLPLEETINRLEDVDADVLNFKPTSGETILFNLLDSFFYVNEENYQSYIHPDLDAESGTFPEFDDSFEDTFHFGTERTFMLIIYLLNRSDIDINKASNKRPLKRPVNLIVEYLMSDELDVDAENTAEIKYTQILEELLPLFFVRGASVDRLYKDQIKFVLDALCELSEKNIENAKEAVKEILRQKNGTTTLLEIYKELVDEKEETNRLLTKNDIPDELHSNVNKYLLQKN